MCSCRVVQVLHSSVIHYVRKPWSHPCGLDCRAGSLSVTVWFGEDNECLGLGLGDETGARKDIGMHLRGASTIDLWPPELLCHLPGCLPACHLTGMSLQYWVKYYVPSGAERDYVEINSEFSIVDGTRDSKVPHRWGHASSGRVSG